MKKKFSKKQIILLKYPKEDLFLYFEINTIKPDGDILFFIDKEKNNSDFNC